MSILLALGFLALNICCKTYLTLFNLISSHNTDLFIYFCACLAIVFRYNAKVYFMKKKEVSQTLISFKINSGNLESLDQLCVEYGIKRNKILNILVSIGLQNLKGNKRMFDLVSVYSCVSFID